MHSRARNVICALALLVAAIPLNAQTSVDRSIPPDEERVVNVPLPDITVTTTRGERLAVTSLADGRPLLLGLVFTRCAGVCPAFLASWRAADARLVDRRIHHLVLSFDPRDSPADMAAFARHAGAEQDPAWTFAVAEADDVKRLAAAAGFWYDWDPSRQQYDHPAMLAAVRNGRLVRLLVAGIVTSGRLDELEREASGEFVASYPLSGRGRFRCVQYDVATGRVSLDWGFALLFLPVGTVGVTTTLLFTAGRRRRGERR